MFVRKLFSALDKHIVACLLISTTISASSASASAWLADFETQSVGPFDPPRGWQIEGESAGEAKVEQESGGARFLFLPKIIGALLTLKIPFPGLAKDDTSWLEVQIGAGPGESKGTVWFLKRGGFELRASESQIFLYLPDQDRVSLGSFETGRIQTIRLLYDAKEQRIVKAELDGKPADNFKGGPCQDLSVSGKLFLYVPKDSNRPVMLKRVQVFAEDEPQASLPRWRRATQAEPAEKAIPPPPVWNSLAEAKDLTFDIDMGRLESPRFVKGLWLTPESLQRLPDAIASDSEMAAYWSELKGTARKMLSEGSWSDLPPDKSDRYIYKLSNQLPSLALLYAATGQEDLGRLLRLLMLDVARRPTSFWIHQQLRPYDPAYPVGKIETGELTRGFSLAFAWVEDLFTEAEKNEIRSELRDKGLDPCMRYIDPLPEKRNNFLALVGGGALLASKVLDDQPAQEKAIAGLEAWLDLVEPDGSYGEPEGYFEFACSRFLMSWWALGREEGKARLQGKSLSKSLAYMAPHFVIHRESASANAWKVNWGDDDFRGGPFPLICESLAYTYNQGLGVWMNQNLTSKRSSLNLYEFLFRLGSRPGDLPAPVSPSEAGLPLAQTFDNGTAFIRSGWTFDKDVLFSLRSGGGFRTGYAHDRPNRNAFLLFVDGDYLLAAPGRASYRSPLATEWDRRTKTHNTITLDGGNQIQKREAKFVEFSDGKDVVYMASEAAGSYGNEPDSMLRQVWYLKENGWFVLEDTVLLKSPAAAEYSLLLANYDKKSRLEPLDGAGWKLIRPSTELSFWISADRPLLVGQTPGYMHESYSYYPGDPGEGKPGSATHMVWSTKEKVPSLKIWTLLIPRSQKLTGLKADFTRDASGDVSWKVSFDGRQFLLNKKAGEQPEISELLNDKSQS